VPVSSNLNLAARYMSLRRIVAIFVLALDAYIVFRIAPNAGMIGPVFQLLGALVGIGALGVLVFNLPLARRPATKRQVGHRDKGWNESCRFQRVAALTLVLVLAVVPLFVIARGVYLGALPSFVRPRGPDVTFAETPGHFLLNLLAYAVCSLVFIVPVLRARRVSKNGTHGISRDAEA